MPKVKRPTDQQHVIAFTIPAPRLVYSAYLTYGLWNALFGAAVEGAGTTHGRYTRRRWLAQPCQTKITEWNQRKRRYISRENLISHLYLEIPLPPLPPAPPSPWRSTSRFTSSAVSGRAVQNSIFSDQVCLYLLLLHVSSACLKSAMSEKEGQVLYRALRVDD